MKTSQLFAATLLGALLLAPTAYCAEAVSAETLPTAMGSREERNGEPTANAQNSAPYSDGTRAIDEGRWSDAVAIFTKIASERGELADGALYWKAYAENKQGQSSHALATCDELRRDHPKSRWIEECGALEIEIHARNGQPVTPQAEQDEDLKLLALNSLMKQDEPRALSAIQQILKGDLPEKFKERAVFILAQGHSKQAQELLGQIAQENSNPLQEKAAEMLTIRHEQTGSLSVATGDTQKPNIQSFVRGEMAEMPAKRDGNANGSHSLLIGPKSRAITLDVVVADKSGKPVTGLQPQDFTIRDNNQPVNIVSFHAVDGVPAKAPDQVEVFLVVDGINSSFDSIANIRQQLVKYLRQNGGHLGLPTSFIFLTEVKVQIPVQPTRDGNALVAQLDDSSIGLRRFGHGGGVYVADERWQRSLRALDLLTASMSKTPGRKMIVWISPGWPGFAGFEWLRTQQDQDELFDYIADVSTALRQARMTLCSADPIEMVVPDQRNFFYRNYLKGVVSAKQADYGDLLLQVLATQTGGQVLLGSHDIASLIDRCTADANAYYVLSFNPPPAAHPNEYHEIKVQIEKPVCKARTRTGYYAQP